MTTSSLLTLDNARMRFGIVLAQSQPSVKTSTVTDRTRARAFDRRKDVEIKTEIVRDTVYVEKRDSSLQVTAYGLQEDPSARSGQATVSSKLSAVSKVLKWIFWILIGLIGLIVTVKVCLLRR